MMQDADAQTSTVACARAHLQVVGACGVVNQTVDGTATVQARLNLPCGMAVSGTKVYFTEIGGTWGQVRLSRRNWARQRHRLLTKPPCGRFGLHADCAASHLSAVLLSGAHAVLPAAAPARCGRRGSAASSTDPLPRRPRAPPRSCACGT